MTHTIKQKYILAIDHGTSGIKAALVSTNGEILEFVYEHTPVYFKDQGGAEQDPKEWWQAILNTSKELLAKALVPIDDIVAVSSSSQWSGTVAVDDQGEALMNAIIWMDSRGEKYLREKVFRGLIKISGYPLRDIIRFLRKTGGAPTQSGKDPISHILFIKYAHPEIYEKTHKFLECIDYLNLKFTGKFAASTTSIILYWITNNRDINNVHYDRGLIKRLKIDREKLPDLQSPISVLGNIKPEIADELGLNHNVKVVMGAPDLQSAVIGSGAIDDYQGHIYIGTSSWLICHVPYKKTDITHNIASIPAVIPGKYFVVNEQETAGASLTFLRDSLFFPEDEDRYGNSQVYQSFDKLVEQVPAGSNGVLFTPWLYGERTPVEDHTLRGNLFNISLTTKREDIIRAAFEGVAFNSRWVLKYVEKFTKRKLDPLNIIGGGARSDVWCQIYADVLNRTIHQMKDPIQANARGAAFIASVTLGYINFEDIPRLTQISKKYTPNPQNVKLYDNLFKEFLFLYENNKKAYHRLNK